MKSATSSGRLTSDRVYSVSSQTETKFEYHGQFIDITKTNTDNILDTPHQVEITTPSGRLPSHDRTSTPLFAGYQQQRESICRLIDAAFFSSLPSSTDTTSTSDEFLQNMSLSYLLKRPKGVLICGPRGTGKSLLMNEIATAYSRNIPGGCHIERLSHDILQSR